MKQMLLLFLLILNMLFGMHKEHTDTFEEVDLNFQNDFAKYKALQKKIGQEKYIACMKLWSIECLNNAERLISYSKQHNGDPFDMKHDKLKAIISSNQVTTLLKINGKEELIALSEQEFKIWAAYIRQKQKKSHDELKPASFKDPTCCDCEIL